jgi:TonB family protein
MERFGKAKEDQMPEFPNRQKIFYQRNLLLGQITGILIFGLISIFMFLTQEATVSIDASLVLPVRLHMDKKSKTGPGLVSADRQPKMAGRTAIAEGAITAKIQEEDATAFKAVRPVQEWGDIGSILYSLKVSRLEKGLMNSAVGGVDAGGGRDIISADLDSYFSGVGTGDFGSAELNPELERGLIIEFVEPRYPLEALGRSGFVTLAIAIDKSGRIDRCRVIQEIPPHLNFAKSLTEAIYRCRFLPTVKGGEKNCVEIVLIYEFCWGCADSARVIAASEGIAVHMR